MADGFPKEIFKMHPLWRGARAPAALLSVAGDGLLTTSGAFSSDGCLFLTDSETPFYRH